MPRQASTEDLQQLGATSGYGAAAQKLQQRMAEDGYTPSVLDTDPSVCTWCRQTPCHCRCPRCHGAEYLRFDVPIEDLRFGTMVPCDCTEERRRARELRERLGDTGLEQLRDIHLREDGRIQVRSRDYAPKAGHEEVWAEIAAFIREPYDRPWLWLWGRNGATKTTLALCVANALFDAGHKPIFRLTGRLLDRINAGINAGDFEERMVAVLEADVLVLDEYGKQSGTQAAESRLFSIFGERFLYRRLTVVTTNRSPNQVDESLHSRIRDQDICRLVHVPGGHGGDDRQYAEREPSR